MATEYCVDFGPANASGAPTWRYFIRADSGADLAPHPAFVEQPVNSGAFNFYIDWASVPAGVVSIKWGASCGGVDLSGVEFAPSATTTASLTATGATFAPWTSDAIIATGKRKGAIPTAQATYQTADFLATADDEIRSYILPLVRRTQEDFYLQSQDFPIVSGSSPVGAISGAQYRVPYRAVGGTLRGVYLLDSSGNPLPVPRVDPDDLSQVVFGVYFMGNVVNFVNRSSSSTPVTLRMTYYLRPSSLVLQANAAKVGSINTGANTVTLANVPASYSGATLFDLVRGKPGFEMLGFDLAGSLAGSVVTFSGGLPADLAVGDYVCLPEQSPVPQIPAELHPLLAERVCAAFLRSQGDREGYELSKGEQARMEADALVMLGQRMGGEVKKVIPRNSLFRRGRVWR